MSGENTKAINFHNNFLIIFLHLSNQTAGNAAHYFLIYLTTTYYDVLITPTMCTYTVVFLSAHSCILISAW